MTIKTIGIVLISSSIIVLLIDISTGIISGFIGAMFCGDRYMKPEDGMVGDMSCGFNADMYLVVFLFIILLAGVSLLITVKRRR